MKMLHFYIAILLMFFTGFLFVAWIWWGYVQWFNKPIVVKPLFPTVTREELQKAQRYHGINYAHQSNDGQWCFDRHGKTCQLFAYMEIE